MKKYYNVLWEQYFEKNTENKIKIIIFVFSLIFYKHSKNFIFQ